MQKAEFLAPQQLVTTTRLIRRTTTLTSDPQVPQALLAARAEDKDADVMTRDWQHDYYGEYLPDAPPAVIWARFDKMVGPPLECGVIESAEQVAAIRQWVAEYSQAQANAAAYTDAWTWPGARLVLWRGCWAVLARQKRNRRWLARASRDGEART